MTTKTTTSVLTLNNSVQCSYCHAAIKQNDGYIHPFWSEEILCETCCHHLPLCAFCERRTSIHIGKEYKRQRQPITCCQCTKLTTLRSIDIPSLFQSVIKFLTTLTNVSFDSMLSSVNVKLCKLDQIAAVAARRTAGRIQMETSATTFGVCVCNPSHDIIQRIGATKNIEILLLRGLSIWLGGAFLAHEVVHALLHCIRQQNDNVTRNTRWEQLVLACDVYLFEEGLCHLAAASWLAMLAGTQAPQSLDSRSRCITGPRPTSFSSIVNSSQDTTNHSEKVSTSKIFASSRTVHKSNDIHQIEFWLKKFLYGQHPEFSIGFKNAKQVVESMGWTEAFDITVEKSYKAGDPTIMTL